MCSGCGSSTARERYRENYERYFTEHASDSDVIADPDARVVLIQNVGLVAVGAGSEGRAHLA